MSGDRAANDALALAWYLVAEDYHPYPHYGLDGNTRPLPSAHPATQEFEKGFEPLPISKGGCLFQGCLDVEAAKRYFLAARDVGRVYLIEVRAFFGNQAMPGVDGYDVGMPTGSFSVIGQEICVQPPQRDRFGFLINRYGLFRSVDSMRAYLRERETRLQPEGLEHLDESVEVGVRILMSYPR